MKRFSGNAHPPLMIIIRWRGKVAAQ
jgi:hypothetical protein